MYYDKYNYLMFEHHDKWLPDAPHEAKGSGKFIVFKSHLRFARKLNTFNLETFGIKFNGHGTNSDLKIITEDEYNNAGELFSQKYCRSDTEVKLIKTKKTKM